MKKLIIGILSLFLLFSCEKKEPVQPIVIEAITDSETNNLSVMSFNIRIFGKTKSSKPEVMDVIIDIIDDHDLIAIQEIRDSSDQTLTTLMAMMPDEYKIVVGPREGRSSSKEQAIFVYDDTVLEFVDMYNDPDPEDVFERSPFSAFFKTKDELLEFMIVNVHLDPHEADVEIPALAQVVEEYLLQFQQDIIVVGDFNSDGRYFKEEILGSLFMPDVWNIVIDNTRDTTVHEADNTYDRIIMTQGLEAFHADVLYFEDYLPDGLEAGDVSDHYPVYMLLEY